MLALDACARACALARAHVCTHVHTHVCTHVHTHVCKIGLYRRAVCRCAGHPSVFRNHLHACLHARVHACARVRTYEVGPMLGCTHLRRTVSVVADTRVECRRLHLASILVRGAVRCGTTLRATPDVPASRRLRWSPCRYPNTA